ncbi:MAG: nucleotidyltransferase family protein [Halocynthiibacter sp.]
MSELSNGLNSCASPPHRAITALIAIAAGRSAGKALHRDLRLSTEKQLVQIAAAHQVHNVVATGFARAPEYQRHIPRDLLIFFEEMQAANRRRNAEIKNRIARIGAAFARDAITAVVVKGGAEILSPFYTEPGHRFLSDIDLLVAEDRLQDAAKILSGFGGNLVTRQQEDSHHLTAVYIPGWPVPVELHWRISRDKADALLPPAGLISRSLQSEFEGIRVPANPDRLVHLIAHAQLHHRRFSRQELFLRDYLDYAVMQPQLTPGEFDLATRRLKDHQCHRELQGFLALAGLLFADQPDRPAEATARRWARASLRNMGKPGRRQFIDTAEFLALYLGQFLTSPEKRKKYLAKLRDPVLRAQWLKFHRDRFRRTK